MTGEAGGIDVGGCVKWSWCGGKEGEGREIDEGI